MIEYIRVLMKSYGAIRILEGAHTGFGERYRLNKNRKK
jgi:hypothetical protein